MRWGLAAVLIGAIAGCCARPVVVPPDAAAAEPAPDYAEVVRRYNERLEGLERVWGRAVVSLRYRDDEGRIRTEQGDDGHIQIILPDRLALTTGKLGKTFYYLGADGERFWWLELREPRRGWVGGQDRIALVGAQENPVPIHPEELMALLGVRRLPERAPGATVARAGGSLVVEIPSPAGTRRFTIDARSFYPTGIDLLDGGERLLAAAELSVYRDVLVRGTAHRPMIPGRVTIRVPEAQTRISLHMEDFEAGSRRPNPAAFDFEGVLRSFGLGEGEIVNLDEQPPAPPGDPRAGADRAAAPVMIDR